MQNTIIRRIILPCGIKNNLTIIIVNFNIITIHSAEDLCSLNGSTVLGQNSTTIQTTQILFAVNYDT